jgi:hypothetical protein
LIENERVLVAGDMVSDALIPLRDLHGGRNPVQDYLDACAPLRTSPPRPTSSFLNTDPSAWAMSFADASTKTGPT